MKCQKCGATLDDGVLFCRECGSKITTEKRFCRECGSRLPENVKFCPSCGTAIDQNISIPNRTHQGEDSSSSPTSISPKHVYSDFSGNVASDGATPFTEGTRFQHSDLGSNSTSLKENNSFLSKRVHFICLFAVIILCLIFVARFVTKNSKASTLVETANDVVISDVPTNYKIVKGTKYSFMSDEWDVYTATAVSDSIINIEHWDKTLKSKKDMSYSEDIGAFKINDSANGFSWVDENHTAFNFTFYDKSNSKIKKPASHVFTIDINDSATFKGTNYCDEISNYVYTCDDWHTYRAIPLTDNLIKIECWSRTSASDSLCYGWDWSVVNTINNNVGFEWTDDDHTSFTIFAQDAQNKSYWKEPSLVLFKQERTSYTFNNVLEYLDNTEKSNTVKPNKDGYDESTNTTEKLGDYVFSLPAYWEVRTSEDEQFAAFAETSGKSAVFQAYLQPTNYENMTDEKFSGIQEEFMSIFARSFDDFTITKSEIFDNTNVTGYLYTCKFATNGFQNNDGWFLLSLDHPSNKYLLLGLMETSNTEYTYYNDFIKILNSLRHST